MLAVKSKPLAETAVRLFFIFSFTLWMAMPVCWFVSISVVQTENSQQLLDVLLWNDINICGHQGTNSTDTVDPLGFPLTPFRGWHFWFSVKCLNDYWMHKRFIWYRYSFSPEDESSWLWQSTGFSFIVTNSSKMYYPKKYFIFWIGWHLTCIMINTWNVSTVTGSHDISTRHVCPPQWFLNFVLLSLGH